MLVEVLGYERISGTSKKTGKPFDFFKAYLQYKRSGVAGYATDALILQADKFPEPIVGSIYDVDRDFNGYLISFEECK